MNTNLSTLTIFRRVLPALGFLASLGCSSEPLKSDAPGGSAGSGGDSGSAGSGGTGGSGGSAGMELPPLVEIGTTLYDAPTARMATALDFNPVRADELWVTLRDFPSGLPCAAGFEDPGCDALQGRVAIIQGASTAAPTFDVQIDPNAWHFMRRPTSIAFGSGGLFATCGESRTANFEAEDTPYTGPALWDSDPAVFGQPQEPEKNGRHMDMLHETPFCMGIAHETENVFWAFNGDAGSLDRYDFNMPHEIGGADHSDGELWRYVTGQVVRVPEVPSHMVFDPASGLLYVADTGNSRIARLDPSTGTPNGSVQAYEELAQNVDMGGALLEDFATEGLSAPTGIALFEGLLVVTDNATSLISVFDASGALVATHDTELPAGSLGGVAIDSAGRLYVSDLLHGRALRLDETVQEIQ